MRGFLFSLAALSVFGSMEGRLAAAEGPVWPPVNISAPAEVEWLGMVDEFRPKGIGRIFRAVAGAGQRQQSWQVPRPVSVAFAKGRVYVVDTALGLVIGAKPDGGSAIRLRLPDDVVPVAIAATRDGESILVADRDSGAVLAFEPKGASRGEVVGGGLVRRSGGLGVCANGDFLITDADAGQVVRVGSDGIEVARSGRRGTGQGEFNTPTAVVEAPDGTIWVLDTFNFRLQQLDPELRFISQFGRHGDGTGHFALAKGLAVDPDGHLYVSDARFDAVQVFNEDGQLLLVVGGHGSGVGEFWNPAGIAIDGTGRIAVADTGNQRVQLLRYQRREGPK